MATALRLMNELQEMLRRRRRCNNQSEEEKAILALYMLDGERVLTRKSKADLT
jgi:hypothetical protein